MALRNPKITRDVLQTCNRFISSKPEICCSSNSRIADHTTEAKDDPTQFRYIISDTHKSNLPQTPKQLVSPEIKYLQPAFLQKYIEFSEMGPAIKWKSATKSDMNNPFPEPIKEFRCKTLTTSIQKKATIKMPALRVTYKNIGIPGSFLQRGFCTGLGQDTSLTISRFYSSRSKRGDQNKPEKCDPGPKQCKKHAACPSFVMRDCTPSKGSDCKHNYIDPKCKKKLAPYPSYSESCAERLPDDPSECMQCPWQKCGGSENIKPNKRYYHTSANMFRQVTTTESAGISENMSPIMPVFDINHCDARKEPCERPPPKCKKEEDLKEKCPESMKKYKKPCKGVNTTRIPKNCSSLKWTEAYKLWLDKHHVLSDEPWVNIVNAVKENIVVDKFASDCEKLPYDKNQADYEHVRKRNNETRINPACHRKKRKLVPDSCDWSDCGVKHKRNKKFSILLSKCGRRSDDECPNKKHPPCPVIDHSINEAYKPKDPCCEKAKRGSQPKSPKNKPRVYVPEKPDY